MNIRPLLKLVPLALLGLAACATDDQADSNSLGIARFATVDNGNVTTVTGYDASGAEVGHVEIFHGVYAASPAFVDGFSSSTVDGRTLSVAVGKQTYHWETEGYVPTLGLPAAPGKYVAMGTFLEQPQVVDVMKRWGIGFEHFVPAPLANDTALGSESPYIVYCDDGSKVGNSWFNATSDSGTGGTFYASVTSVRLPNGETANTCGASVAANTIGVITTTIGGVSQYAVVQVCDLGGSTNIYRKTCPAGTGTASQCGTTSGACVGCGVYGDALGTTSPGPSSTETVSALNAMGTTTTLNGRETITTSCN